MTSVRPERVELIYLSLFPGHKHFYTISFCLNLIILWVISSTIYLANYHPKPSHSCISLIRGLGAFYWNKREGYAIWLLRFYFEYNNSDVCYIHIISLSNK